MKTRPGRQGTGIARRRFLRVVPAAVAGAVAAPAIAEQTPAADLRIKKDTLDCAEKIFGVDFTDGEEEAIVRGVNRTLDSFESLRKLEIPPDTEPPLDFRPYLPPKRPKGGATPGARIKVALTPPAARPSSIEEL